ncbi:hypothetical protein MT418_007371 [Batrachochytrium dendrobatidis]
MATVTTRSTASQVLLQPTAQQSLTVVRNVLGATIGSITYLRNVFPEHNFKDTRLNGLQLKTLVPKQTSQADLLISWIDRGCCDALNKQYLRTMVFGIYVNESCPEELTEAYTFSFSYPDKDRWCISVSKDGKDQFRFKTRQDVTRATCEMLRHLLVLTQTMNPLPENAYLTMKLYYYDNITPPDYQPPMFCAGIDTPVCIAGEKLLQVNLGQVSSPYHALSLKVHAPSLVSNTGENNEQEDESVNEFETEMSIKNTNVKDSTLSSKTQVSLVEEQIGRLELNAVHMPNESTAHKDRLIKENQQTTQELIDALKIGSNVASKSRATVKSTTGDPKSHECDTQYPYSPVPGVQSNSRDFINDTQADTQPLTLPNRGKFESIQKQGFANEERNIDCDVVVRDQLNTINQWTGIRCPCGVNEHGPNLVQCRWCKLWSHAICLGYLPTTKHSSVHTCHECARSNDGKSPESILQTALIRHALFRIWDLDGISTIAEFSSLIHVKTCVAKQVVQWLENLGILEKKPTFKALPQGYKIIRSAQTQSEFSRLFPFTNIKGNALKIKQRSAKSTCLGKTVALKSVKIDCVEPLPISQSEAVGQFEKYGKELAADCSIHPLLDTQHSGKRDAKLAIHEGVFKRRKVSVVKKNICTI